MKEFFAEPKTEPFSPLGSKKLSYKKPLLRALAPEEQQCSRQLMQEFIAYMQSLGAKPNQNSFEAYLISRGYFQQAAN